MRQLVCLFTAAIMLSSAISAREPDDSLQSYISLMKKMDSIESNLHYQKGNIKLGSTGNINVPAGFKFLAADEAKYVLEDIWGNINVGSPLGLLLPENSNVTGEMSYAFVVEYEALGYVKDSDADKINYDELMTEMKAGNLEFNKELKAAGAPAMTLMGWASKPYYDKQNKILHWAKEIQIEGDEVNTLNYDVRVLGRNGVMTLQAITSIDNLDTVKAHINEVVGMVNFSDGERYSDFNSSTDKVAAYTVGGLVAGKVLAKVGFFAIILKYIKFIILGIGLAGGAIWKFITGRRKRKEEEQYVYQPQQASPTDTPIE